MSDATQNAIQRGIEAAAQQSARLRAAEEECARGAEEIATLRRDLDNALSDVTRLQEERDHYSTAYAKLHARLEVCIETLRAAQMPSNARQEGWLADVLQKEVAHKAGTVEAFVAKENKTI